MTWPCGPTETVPEFQSRSATSLSMNSSPLIPVPRFPHLENKDLNRVFSEDKCLD